MTHPDPTAARRRRIRLRGLLIVLACAGALLGSCGKKSAAPTQPPLAPPPEVLATVPAARATGVLYDGEIYVDFARDMSSFQFSTTNVFLKKDTERVPIVLSLENGGQRVRLIPQAPLGLRKTYTVEFTGLRSPTPSAISNGWYFQFTTNSVRRPNTPRPAEATKYESPFVMVSWDSTEVSAGAIRYELWAGPDSNAVADRVGTPRTTLTRPRWMPTTAWPLGSANYWAVTVINNSTGESLAGPTHRFDTLAADTPLDSLLIPAGDSGFNTILTAVDRVNPYQTCGGDSLLCLTGYQAWIQFPLSQLPADVKVAFARIEVSTWPHYVNRLQTTPISMWSSTRTWPLPCRPALNFPDQYPDQDQVVAIDTPMAGRWMGFQGALLSAHLEASVRRGGYFGYTFTSPLRFALGGTRMIDPTYRPVLRIHYFRTSAAPPAAPAP